MTLHFATEQDQVRAISSALSVVHISKSFVYHLVVFDLYILLNVVQMPLCNHHHRVHRQVGRQVLARVLLLSGWPLSRRELAPLRRCIPKTLLACCKRTVGVCIWSHVCVARGLGVGGECGPLVANVAHHVVQPRATRVWVARVASGAIMPSRTKHTR